MQLETLKIFCDVVRHRSFSEGARANGVSQSAASQSVLQLERRLEVELIDRSKRPWELTSAGRTFFEGSQEIIERYLELEETVRGRRDGGAPRYIVRVAAIYSVGLHNMNARVEKFREIVEGADVEIDYMHPRRVLDRVLKGEADLGLLSFASTTRDLVATPWREDEMVLTCLPGHRFGTKDAIEPAALQGERFIRFEKGLPIRRGMDAFLKERDVEVRVVAEFDNVDTIKQAVVDGVGVAILPQPTLRREVAQGILAAVRFAGAPFKRPLSIVRRRRKHQHHAVVEFVNLLRLEIPAQQRSAEEVSGQRDAMALGQNRVVASPRKASGEG